MQGRFFLVLFLCLVSIFSFAQPLELLSPKNGQLVSGRVNFSWYRTEGADRFHFVLGKDINLSDTLIVTASDQIRLSLPTNGSYLWRVLAYNGSQLIDSSKVGIFYNFDPHSIDSLNLWLRADSGLLLNGNQLVSWADLSDSSVQISQNTQSRQPLFIPNALNGFPVVRFDSTDDRFISQIELDGPSFSISSVYNCRENKGRGIRLFNGSNNWLMGPFTGFYRVFNGGFINGMPIEQYRYVCHSLRSESDTNFNYVNNIFFGQRLSSYPPGNTLTISQNGLNGDLAELIVVNGFVSDSLRSLIDQYLMDKFAPPVNLGGDRIVCAFPDTLILDRDYIRSYQWSNADTTSMTIIDSAGVYYLDAIDEFGRLTSDTIVYYLDTANAPSSFSFSDTTICAGESIEIIAGPKRFGYQWNTGGSTNSLEIDSAGLYQVTVSNCASAISMDSFNVKVNQPRFSLGADRVICFNETYRLESDSVFSNVDYLWSTGDTADFITANSSDSYSLTVVDEFNCSFSDTVVVTSDSNLFTLDLGPDTSLCEGNEIALLGDVPSGLSYLWGTGNTNPTQIVDTAGSYTLRVSDSLCSISDTLLLAIQGQAPTADFSFNELCFGDSVSFVNSSIAPSGDSLISFSWDFAGLTNDTIQNPFYAFPDTGNFLVELKVITDKGCEDTTAKLIDIKPLPQVDFSISGNCTESPLQFTNNSTISQGSLQTFNWDFGDGTQSSLQNPDHTYNSLGNFTVKLLVSSNQGCSDSLLRNFRVNPKPNSAYQLLGSCLGDSTKMISTSTIDTGSIASYTWFINQQVIEDSVAKILFLSGGNKALSFRTESDSGCVELLRDTIEIFRPPLANFSAPDPCDGDSLRVIDSSLAQGDTIESFLYQLYNGQINLTSSQQNPSFELPNLGDYQLKQIVESSNGCRDSLSQSVSLNPNPVADFQILNNGSGIPMTLDVNNTSTLASIYEWTSGDGQNSSLLEPEFLYTDTGTYQLGLIARSDADCRDTLIRELLVLPSLLDAAILDAQILPGLSNDFRIRLQLANQGNNQIEQLLISVLPDADQGLAEVVNVSLYRGQSVYQLLNSIVVNDDPKPSFICFEIESVNGIKDENPLNDRFCLSAFPEQLFLRAYPNPFKEQLEIEFVLLKNSIINISLTDASGKEALSIVNDQAYTSGFNRLTVPTETLTGGVYLLRFQVNGNTNDIKLIKQ